MNRPAILCLVCILPLFALAEESVATIKGKVVSEDGQKPLSGVRVRAAVPATDMRQLRKGTDKCVEGVTNAEGVYELRIPVTKATNCSVDAFLPGYRSSAGTFASGGDFSEIDVSPNSVAVHDIQLPPALYIAGKVVDAHQNPLPGIDVSTMLHNHARGSTAYIASTRTAADGSFEIFDFPIDSVSIDRPMIGFALKPDSLTIDRILPNSLAEKAGLKALDVITQFDGRAVTTWDDLRLAIGALPQRKKLKVEVLRNGQNVAVEIALQPVKVAERGEIVFSSEVYREQKIADVYALKDEERRNLRIVMDGGIKIAGAVKDKDGKPVPDVLVEAWCTGTGQRKGITTKPDGSFVMAGVPPGKTELRVHAKSLKQKVIVNIAPEKDLLDFELKLQPIPQQAPPAISVLGMKVVDCTDDVAKIYDLGVGLGVVVIDPGEKAERFQIGRLEEGDCFWLINDKSVANVREWIAEILAGQKPTDKKLGARVVYRCRRKNFIGTNTQFMELTPEDITSLNTTLEALNADKK